MNWQNLAKNLNQSTRRVFAEPVTHKPIVGSQQTTSGIFDENHIEIDPETNAVISSNSPVLGINLADFVSEPKRNDLISIRGIDYKIVDLQEDSAGHAKVLLHKA